MKIMNILRNGIDQVTAQKQMMTSLVTFFERKVGERTVYLNSTIAIARGCGFLPFAMLMIDGRINVNSLFFDLTEDEQEAALQHEEAHRDLGHLAILQKGANGLRYALIREWRMGLEMAADAEVNNKSALVSVLTKINDISIEIMGVSNKDCEKRIERLLNPL